MAIFYLGPKDGNVMEVQLTHYMPDQLPAEMLGQGVLLDYTHDTEPQPPVVNEMGKSVIKKVNLQTKEVFYEIVDRPLTPEEEQRKKLEELQTKINDLNLEKNMMTANEYYDSLDKESTDLETLKQAKINALNETCEETINAGFYSKSMDATYDFATHDQMNFTQQLILTVAKPQEKVYWKTKDKGILEHTPDQFLAVVIEAEQHKRKNIEKYWRLKALVVAAQTKEEVDKVTWEENVI